MNTYTSVYHLQSSGIVIHVETCLRLLTSRLYEAMNKTLLS